MASYTAAYRDIDIKATITLRTGTQFTVTSTDIYSYTADSTAAASGIPLGEAVSGSFSLSVTASACPYSAEQLDGAVVRMSMGVRNDTTSSYTYTDAGAWYVTNVSSPEGSSAVTLKGSDALGVFFDGIYADDVSAYPTTMGGLLALVCAIAGASLKTTTFFNSDVVISTRPSWGEETSLRSIVGYIAACAAGFAQIDQSGKLEIITDGQGTKVSLDGDIYNQFTPEGGSRFAFNCIRVTLPPASEDDTEGETVRVAIDSSIADDASNCVVVDNNPLMTEALAATVRDKLNGVEFEGYSVDWLGDPAVMCGHIMELTALDGVKHKGLVTSRKLTFDGGLSMKLTSTMPAMHSTSSHYTSAGRLFNSDGTLPVYRVSGVSGAVVNAMLAKFDRVIAGDITTDTFFARMAKIVELSVQNLEADTIDAKIINTGSLDATKITAGSITAEQIKAGAVTAESGIIANGAIGTAQIADGSITEAKVVSLNADVIKTGTLSAERLLLAGDNGVIYKINATSAGLTMTELSQDQYKHYINGTVIVAKSITAAQIAAKTITGNEILAGSITASEIDVADLFANEATIQALNAMDITGNSYLRLYVTNAVDTLGTRVTAAETSLQLKADQATLTSTASGLQSQIDAIPGQISLEVSQVQVGGTQLLRDTKALTVGTDADSWRYSTYASMYTDPSGFNRIKLNSTGATANTWTNAMSPITRLKSGWLNREVTLSAWMYSPDWAAIDGSLLFGVYLTKGDTTRLNFWEKDAVVAGQVQLSANATSNVPLANNTWVRISVKLKLSTENMKGDGVLTDNTHMYAGWYLARNGDVRIHSPKLEFGNRSTDWSAYPEEFNAGSSIRMNTEEVRITTPEFNVDIVGDDGETNMLSIDENGAQMPSLICPNVAPRYGGPSTLYVNSAATSAQIEAGTHYRSIVDAAAALSNRWIDKDIVVNIAAGTVEYGTVTLQGANGSGSIYIIGDSSSPAKLVGKLQIMYSGCPVLVRYLNVDSASGGVGIDCAGSATMAIIENCVITGKGVSVSGGRGVRTFRGAHADVHSCELYDHERSLYAQQTGAIRAYANKGNCRVAADGGTIYASGAMPCDTTSFAYGSYAGQIVAASDVTVNQGSKPTAEAIPTTVNVTASATDSWYSASSAWINQDNVIRQGYYSGMGEWSGCFWFPTTAFSGKTIKTAILTLTRTAGSGKSGEVTLTLYGITIASASGDPNSGRVSYGALGVIGNGETKAFTLPTAAAQALASGTIKGFMLCAGDGAVMSGRSYSKNYCKIGSAGDTLPQLSISY